MLRIINIDGVSSCLQQLITKALLAVTEVLAQSVARDVGRYAKERWFECKKPTFTSSVSPVQVRLGNHQDPTQASVRAEKNSCSVQSPGESSWMLTKLDASRLQPKHPSRSPPSIRARPRWQIYTIPSLILLLVYMLCATISPRWGFERIRVALQET